MNLDLGRALFSTLDALDRLGIRYAIVGGLAVGAWGVSRSTRDVDIYAELPPERRALERALSEQGFHVPAMEEELERYGVFRSRSPDGVFVDIFPAVGPLGEAILERRKSISVAGRPLWFIAPEELAVLKAFSDRPRDFEDLVNLSVVVGPKLDVLYIQQWARRLDESLGGNEVSERVEDALRQRKPAQQRKRKRPRTPR
ncbi:MAG TPA: nucleotidyltransferase [Polyangiaceae bacterium]|jgi:predicted nucleotidyltransferase|nr:nucleotidyltransferase [Polyangiaceae bacterium]